MCYFLLSQLRAWHVALLYLEHTRRCQVAQKKNPPPFRLIWQVMLKPYLLVALIVTFAVWAGKVNGHWDWQFGFGMIGIPVAMTAFILSTCPPYFNWGHRLFQVANPDAEKAVLDVLKRLGLKQLVRFKAGPAQTLLNDRQTVIALFDENEPRPMNAITIGCVDPQMKSAQIARVLREYNFDTHVSLVTSIPGNSLFQITSSAMVGWCIVCRKLDPFMPNPEMLPKRL